MPSLEDLGFAASQQIGRTQVFFPLLRQLGDRWAAQRPWEGMTLGLNLHLTTLTAALLQELALGGARCSVSAANPATTDAGAVQVLRGAGIEVHTGRDRKDGHAQVLAAQPTLLVDAGFDLIAAAVQDGQGEAVRGAVITSRTAVHRLREHGALPFPVVDLASGRLHDAVENRHGIGEAVWQAVSGMTGMHLAGRRACVVGYGPVGRGIASWARAAGMAVEVVEADPVRRLFAHYDGFATPELPPALARTQVVVTATGREGVLDVERLREAGTNLVLLNAGTGGDEIDVDGIVRAAELVDMVAEDIVRYTLESGQVITLLGRGHPLNIVRNAGSPEPVLLQHAVVGLALAWLAEHPLAPGTHVVPPELEVRAAELALAALDAAPGR